MASLNAKQAKTRADYDEKDNICAEVERHTKFNKR